MEREVNLRVGFEVDLLWLAKGDIRGLEVSYERNTIKQFTSISLYPSSFRRSFLQSSAQTGIITKSLISISLQ